MNQRSPSSLLSLIYPLVFVAAIAVFGIGIYRLAMPGPHDWTMLAAGCVSLVAVGVSWPIALVLSRLAADSAAAAGAGPSPVLEKIDEMTRLMNVISEQQLLSDRAKAIAFRHKDRDALRHAILEEIGKQDWEAARALADLVEQAFGNRAEAQSFRDEIDGRRQEMVRKQINDVVAIIDRHTRGEQWSAALREAERLQKLFPDHEQVKNLPHEIDNRRQAHKRQLNVSWHEAVARHDNDGAIEILKQLDTYLTPAEAEAMQETVRQVFKEKLNSLGAQFASAVHDHKWAEAIRVGETITRDFPNTRIAQEVRDKMDALRARAAEIEPAGASA